MVSGRRTADPERHIDLGMATDRYDPERGPDHPLRVALLAGRWCPDVAGFASRTLYSDIQKTIRGLMRSRRMQPDVSVVECLHGG
jgi:hypothetical protein